MAGNLDKITSTHVTPIIFFENGKLKSRQYNGTTGEGIYDIQNSIQLNNGILEYRNYRNWGETEGPITGWYRNGEKVGPDYSFVHTPTGLKVKVFGYNPQDYLFVTPNLGRFNYLAGEPSRDNLYVPHLDVEKVRLNIPGSSQHLANIPVNVLDTIAINAGRANIPIQTALGLVGKESTFGSSFFNFNDPRPTGEDQVYITHHGLTNNHRYDDNKYADINAQLLRNVSPAYDMNKSLDERAKIFKKVDDQAKWYLDHPEKIKERTDKYHSNILADSFIRYMTNPQKYNPGQKNYVDMVKKISEEVWSDKGIQKWWNKQGKNFYKQGQNEVVDRK